MLIATGSFLNQNCKIFIPTYRKKSFCAAVLYIKND
jgi:hypothetical protein